MAIRVHTIREIGRSTLVTLFDEQCRPQEVAAAIEEAIHKPVMLRSRHPRLPQALNAFVSNCVPREAIIALGASIRFDFTQFVPL